MFWNFLIASAVAAGLIQLGALSVWVSVLSVALQVAIGVIVIGAGIPLWKRYAKS